jgi:hypothetical protein
VIDIIEGLEDYERRIKGDQSQPEAFLTVFGVPCVCETLRQKKTFLQNLQAYDNELLNQFINLGRVHSARWAFLRDWSLDHSFGEKHAWSCLHSGLTQTVILIREYYTFCFPFSSLIHVFIMQVGCSD